MIRRVLFVAFLFLTCCTGNEDKNNYKQGETAEQKGDFQQAELNYKKIFDQSSNQEMVVKSAEKLFNLHYHRTRNYREAYKYLKFIIPNTTSFEKSLDFAKKKALIEFTHLNLYEKSIESFSKILANKLDQKEEVEIRKNMVRAHSIINNNEQALNELEEVKKLLGPQVPLDIILLEGSIYQAQGELDKAILLYKDAEKKLNKEELWDLILNLALCYEEKKDYKNAIDSLNRLKSKDSFVLAKIEQLNKLYLIKKRGLRK